VAALPLQRLGQDPHGGRATTGVYRGTGQTLRQLVVEAGGGLAGRLQQQAGVGGQARFQLPGTEPKQIIPPAQAADVEGGRQPVGDRAEPACRQGGSQHLTVQRMGQAGEDAAAGSLQHKQAALLGCLDRVAVGQPLEHDDGQRLAPGDQLHGRPGRLGKGVEAGRDQLSEPCRAGQFTRPAPHPLDLVQRTGLPSGQDQLAQVQRVPLRHPQHLLPGHSIDCSTQDTAQQLGGRLWRQGRQLEAPGGTVLPERHYRVGCWCPAPERDQHDRLVVEGELVHQRGRGVIQQVRVINPEDQWSPAASLGEHGRGSAEGVQTVTA
jgi:hypothetical protein